MKLKSFIYSSLLFPSLALATNGYFDYGYGITHKGMAGAGSALPADTLIMATNPAGITELNNRIDLGLTIFSPRREYQANATNSGSFIVAPGTHKSDSNYFPIPEFGLIRKLDNRSYLGFSLYGNGGMNTDYKTADLATLLTPGGLVSLPGVYGAGNTSIDLKQLFANLTYARSFSSHFSGGLSLIGVGQTLKVNGLSNFAGFTESFTLGNPVTRLSNRKTAFSYGLGAKIGVLGKLNEWLNLSASWQPRIPMTRFSRYADLLAKHGHFDIPSTLTTGLALAASQQLHFLLDYQRIWFNQIAAVGHTVTPIFTCGTSAASNCLGGSNGPGFGWKNINVYKLGLQWASSPEWTWRAGYSHTDQPIPTTETLFNILAPAVIRNHITAGFSHAISDDQTINAYAMYALPTSVKGANPFAPSQTIRLAMRQYALGLGWSWLSA